MVPFEYPVGREGSPGRARASNQNLVGSRAVDQSTQSVIIVGVTSLGVESNDGGTSAHRDTRANLHHPGARFNPLFLATNRIWKYCFRNGLFRFKTQNTTSLCRRCNGFIYFDYRWLVGEASKIPELLKALTILLNA